MFDRHARETGQLDLIAAIQRQSLRLVETLERKVIVKENLKLVSTSPPLATQSLVQSY